MIAYRAWLIVFCCLLAPVLARAQGAASWRLDEAVRYALAHSPDSQAARHRLAAAVAARAQARAAFYPRLDLAGGYSATDNPMYSFGNILNQGTFTNNINFNDPGRTDRLGVSAKLRYRLYSGGGDLAALRAARAMEAGSAMELAALHNRLAFEVRRGFWTVVQARDLLTARRAAVEALKQSLAAARARFRAGSLLKVEVVTLEAQLSRARENLIVGRNNLELAKRRFLNLLGLDFRPFSLVVPAGSGGEEDMKQQEPSGQARRPELLVAEEQVRAAREELRKARAGYLPQVGLYADRHYEKGSETGGSGNSWQAGVEVSLPLFDGHLTSQRVAAAEARLAEAREQRRKLSLAIALERQQARLNIREARERLQVAGKMVAQAEESARLNRARFQAGVILAADLIDAERRLTEARVRRSVALAALRIARADLRRAFGLDGEAKPDESQEARIKVGRGADFRDDRQNAIAQARD